MIGRGGADPLGKLVAKGDEIATCHLIDPPLSAFAEMLQELLDSLAIEPDRCRRDARLFFCQPFCTENAQRTFLEAFTSKLFMEGSQHFFDLSQSPPGFGRPLELLGYAPGDPP